MIDSDSSVIHHSKMRRGFKELTEARTLLAFLECRPLSINYCEDFLKIEDPVRLIPVLNAVGAMLRFQVILDKDTICRLEYRISMCDPPDPNSMIPTEVL